LNFTDGTRPLQIIKIFQLTAGCTSTPPLQQRPNTPKEYINNPFLRRLFPQSRPQKHSFFNLNRVLAPDTLFPTRSRAALGNLNASQQPGVSNNGDTAKSD
jgi:hypothetical protein